MTTITAPTPTGYDVEPAAIPKPTERVSASVAAGTVAARTLRKFVRSPQLLVVESLIAAMFLLIFRYVFGGAIETGGIAYADFLIPGMAAISCLFSSTVVGVAEDAESGLFDRLRSLPIPRGSVLLGRSLADTALVAWGVLTTVALGFATGFRFHGSLGEALLALGLCVVFGAAMTWPLIWMGLNAGGTQAAQGMGFLTFPFAFVSSAYVPVHTMPGWLQPVAEHQPITHMVGAVRALCLGDEASAILGHSAGWFAVRALLWCAAIAAVFAVLATRRFAKG